MFQKCKALLGILIILCSTQVIHASEPDEVVVLLSSEHALLPTYVGKIEAEETDCSPTFLNQLRQVLCFDISHNGMTRLIEGNKEPAIQAAISGGFSKAPDLEALRKSGLSYLVMWKIKGYQLDIKIVQVASGTIRTIGPILCTGDEAKDRIKIHRLADCIQETLFGSKGVASSKIAFIVKRKIGKGDFMSELCESDYDGHNLRQLTHTNSLVATPTWIPPKASGLAAEEGAMIKSQTVLYVSYQTGQPKLYALSLKDGRNFRVSTMRGNQLTPAISADGSSLAFCSDITGTADLYLVPFEVGVGACGKPRQIFHTKGTATACPTFSPDGKKIAFVSNKDGGAKIYIMDTPKPGSKLSDITPTLISKRVREATAPSWSPDGKKIAYSAKIGGERQIWIYDCERKSEEQLTSGKGSKESPSFGPDSLHLMFHSISPSGTDIYMVNLNQPEPVRITSGAGDKLFPIFEP
jgi:TolB protein